MTRVIGITGGIASGKSTLARMLARRGMLHVDADKLVHQLLATHKPMIDAIGRVFPGTVQGGQVDRQALGAALADDPAKLHRLEQLLHPAVRLAEERAIRQATRQRRRAVLLDVPLLFETGTDHLCDAVIVAYAPLVLRRRRALARGMKPATFNRLVARQLSDAERMALADEVIPTTLGKAHTRRRVEALLRRWGL